MKDKILAIKGHPTRGNEVIEILEMLGGKNTILVGKDVQCFYYIDTNNNFMRLGHTNYCNPKDFIIFTLEEFLEKYPFKVGDKVLLNNQVKVIKSIRWDCKKSEIIYTLETNINGVKTEYQVFNYDLQPYKEEIWTYYANNDDSKTDIIINGEKLIAPNGYTIGNATSNSNKLIVEYIKNKPQYPKTFEECCNVLQTYCTVFSRYGYKEEQIALFQKLLICRDAYWKIKGEEMGLSEPWKPDWNDVNFKYCIKGIGKKIERVSEMNIICILAFPTKEMRDAFFENFKDLIEQCKEFL